MSGISQQVFSRWFCHSFTKETKTIKQVLKYRNKSAASAQHLLLVCFKQLACSGSITVMLACVVANILFSAHSFPPSSCHLIFKVNAVHYNYQFIAVHSIVLCFYILYVNFFVFKNVTEYS